MSAREVLVSGLKRAIDWRVVFVCMLSGMGSVGLTMLLELVGPDVVPNSVAHLLWSQVRTLIALAPSTLGSACALRIVIASERDESPAFGSVVRRFPMLYLAQLFSSFALGLSISCFVIPVFFVGVVISVLMPVVLEEGVGPLKGWSRCRELIENRGDAVTIVVLVTWLMMGLIVAATLLPFGLGYGFAPFVHALNAMSDPVLDAALVVERLTYGSLWAGVSGVLYVRLRERELPAEAYEIAKVFA